MDFLPKLCIYLKMETGHDKNKQIIYGFEKLRCSKLFSVNIFQGTQCM